MTLELIKIEDGFFNGKVTYHLYQQKTVNEIEALEKKIEAKNKRKEEQKNNLQTKKIVKKRS